jgi:L-lactate utilization protein LutC
MTDLVELFAENARAVGFHVHFDEEPAVEKEAVSEALYGVAATGSVVLAASPDEPRAKSLLPRVHVSRLARDRILPGLPELFERMAGRMPSSLVLVTGPSQSGDIEMRRTVGIHGPVEVHVSLYERKATDGSA